MPDSIRQQLVTAVIAQLRLISVANGYQTEIGAGTIDDWPTQYDQAALAELPLKAALGVHDLENQEAQADHSAKMASNELRLQVRIYRARDLTPATLRQMVADVKKALRAGAATGLSTVSKRLAYWVEPKSDGFVIPQENFEVVGAAIECALHYEAVPFSD
jgi:hypothetical protein